MLAQLVRWIILRLVMLFYPRIEVRGRELLPADGPALFVANHPNGLLDPLVLMTGVRRPIAFLAKSTFFANPAGRLAMGAFSALPVYRQRDEGQQGGATGDRANRNEWHTRHRPCRRRHHPARRFDACRLRVRRAHRSRAPVHRSPGERPPCGVGTTVGER